MIDITQPVNGSIGEFSSSSFLRVQAGQKASKQLVTSVLNTAAKNPEFDADLGYKRSKPIPKHLTKDEAKTMGELNRTSAKKQMEDRDAEIETAERNAAEVWMYNMELLLIHMESATTDAEREILLIQSWRWATAGFQEYKKGEIPLDVALVRYGQTRKKARVNELEIFAFRETLLEFARSVIDVDEKELTKAQKCMVTKAENREKRPGDYRCRKSGGKLFDENNTSFGKVRGTCRSFLNQLVIRKISSMDGVRKFLNDLPDHLSYIRDIHQRVLECMAGQFFASQKGSKQCAISCGTENGHAKLKGRKSPALTIIVPVINAKLIDVPNGRQQLHLKVFRDPAATPLIIHLTSGIPELYVQFGNIKLVTPSKKSKRLEVQFTVPVMQMASKFRDDVPVSTAAVDMGQRVMGMVTDGRGNVFKIGEKERSQLRDLRILESKYLSAADSLQNKLIKTERDRAAGKLNHVSAADYQAYRDRCRSEIRKLRRLADEARQRHRHIVDSLHDQLINLLTRYTIIVMPMIDLQQWARGLKRPFARELMSFRLGEMIQKLKARCEITGSILIRGDERFSISFKCFLSFLSKSFNFG